MTATELRKLYVDYFKTKGHKEIASASLLPENDPSVLFTTAGMHPLIPYLLGERHPLGNRLVGIQKCVRTCDIDEVGDPNHLIFFEMLGNWSLGDYFKSESIEMSYDFLTQHLYIPSDKLAVTVFEGDEYAPRDVETYEVMKSHGLTNAQIYYYDREENWWGPAGITGPCGPDTEIFFDTGKPKCSEACGPACKCKKFIEIWNKKRIEEHQILSRQGAEQKFKGGMADNSEQTTRLHTATHLLNGALRKVLGEGVHQRGSNITSERLRFDFSFDRKLTANELSEVQAIVNEAIRLNIEIQCEEISPEEAKVQGAIGVFDNMYGDKVKIYSIPGYSKEICGGPHASRTGELIRFEILKEESSSSGIRRIKAVLG